MLRKVQFLSNLSRTSGTLRQDQYEFFSISRFIRLRMRNVSDKSCKENQNTRFIFHWGGGNRALYEIMWKNM